MICLMDAEGTPAGRMAKKQHRGMKGQNGVKCRQITVLGMRTVYITIEKPRGAHPRKVKKLIENAAAQLRAQRAPAVLFSENFPYREQILREGFMETDERPLMEMLAGTIARRAAGGEKSAVLFTERLTSNVLKTLSELCRSFRTVMLVSDSGNDACRSIGRQLGVSIVFNPPAGQIENADAAVFFNAPHNKVVLSEKTAVIPTARGALLGVSYGTAVSGVDIELDGGAQESVPDGFALTPLAAAAVDCMALGRASIRLRGICFQCSGDAIRHRMT